MQPGDRPTAPFEFARHRQREPMRPSVGAALVGVVAMIAALLALSAPAGAQPAPDLGDATITVDPATGLVDRQTVQVTGADFDPASATFGAAQCSANVIDTMDIASCDLSTSVIGTVADDGTIDVTLTVQRIITTSDGSEIDCAVEDACVIGAATLGNDLITPVEGTAAFIAFDPSVPPVPELEIDLEVEGLDGNVITGTVTCNRPASFSVSIFIEQTRGRQTTFASGFQSEPSGCDVEPVSFAVPLSGGNGRLVGGPATFNASASAFDGVESAFDDESGDFIVRGAQRLPFVQPEVEGEFTAISVLGVEGRGGDQRVLVEVTCDRPFTNAFVFVQVAQFAGRQTVTAFASTVLEDGCDGTQVVEVPLEGSTDGVLAGGPAQVSASISAEDFQPPDFAFDFASDTATVKLRGLVRGPAFEVQPDPDSRIVIGTVSRQAISGTVSCEEPATVFLSGTASQTRGRTTSSEFGFTELECDGVTSFTIPLDGDLRGGPVDVFVSAQAFDDDDPFGEFLFFDSQQASTRVRGRS